MAKIIRFPGTKARPKGARRKRLSTKLNAMAGDERFVAVAVRHGLDYDEWLYLMELAALFDHFRKKI